MARSGREEHYEALFYLIALISTLGINSVTWAGPAEEIAQVIQQQSAAGQKPFAIFSSPSAGTFPCADTSMVTVTPAGIVKCRQ